MAASMPVSSDSLGPDLIHTLTGCLEQQPRLLGTTENALGLQDLCKERGWDLVVTSDKEGPNSKFQKEVVDAEYVAVSRLVYAVH